ncbi:MAG: hypothetical protein J5802_13075 [Butyrivibrio sp.]|nr:hypothetical protein [Butyrivibrio sp.]
MDKVEYKIRADEIKALIGEGRFAEAVKIADTIDWKRVKSVAMLCTISDLYKINRRFEESRDVLLMAYDRHPTGRAIVYSLCELAIKMGEFVQAVEYYKEFVRIAPRDTGRYILQYKLYEAQEVSLEERIAVLEEFKKHDYREKWVYELAYLYHRIGLTTECIETCDEMFLWLGDGNYVMKALELKALHEPLSPEQQDRYVRYKQKHGGYIDRSIVYDKKENAMPEQAPAAVNQPTQEMPPVNPTVPVNSVKVDPVAGIKEPSVDVSEYNTVDLQQALAEELKEYIGGDEQTNAALQENPFAYLDAVQAAGGAGLPAGGIPVGQAPADQMAAQAPVQNAGEMGDGSFSPVSATIGESTQGSMEEVFFESKEEQVPEESVSQPVPEQVKEAPKEPESFDDEETKGQTEEFISEYDTDRSAELKLEQERMQLENNSAAYNTPAYENRPLEDEVPGAVIHPNASYNMTSQYDNMLAQEHDGQLSMAVEKDPAIERQITGQISIAEYIQNWEQFKKDQQEKQFESVKKKVADQTGDLFADYDMITKAGLQEKIEKAIAEAIKKEKQNRASGRGDWSRDNADIIDEAVDEVINSAFAHGDGSEEVERIDLKETEEVFEDENIEEEKVESVESDEAKAEVDAEAPEDDARDKRPSRSGSRESEGGRPERAKSQRNRPDGDRPERQDRARSERQRPEDRDTEDREATQGAKKKLKKSHTGSKDFEERVRKMTPEEKELFGPYIHHKKSRRQIIKAIDNMSLDAFSGNVIVTGEEGAGTINLAKGLIRAVQTTNSTFSGKVAKITANTLNKKSPASIFEKLANGALIIQRAADITPETAADLMKILQEGKKGIIIVMEDTKEDINRFLDKNPDFKESFNVRVDIEALDDDSLVAYAKQYAYDNEYAIDNLGILALHTIISERQTLDHDVTVSEVRDIVDDAIYYAEKRSVSHFVDIIVNKRFDENDMVILREKDFMH